MFSSLKVPYFRLYWCGMFVSLIGTWIQIVAQSWLVFQLTNSAFLLGLVGFLGSIPVFMLSLFGGVLADRVEKRKILLFTQAAFMISALLLAVLTQLKIITPLQIMFIALSNGIIMAFDSPARQSIVVELVGKKHLFNAIALNSVAFNSSRIIGPALAGLLISAIGMSGCFYLNGASFLAVIIALFFIRLNKNEARNTNPALDDIKAALVFISGHRLILALVSLVAAMSLFGISYIILMPVFAGHVLGLDAKGLGVLMSSVGIGALVGALSLAGLGDFRFKGRLLIWSVFIFSFSLMAFSISRSYPFALLALVFVGACSVFPVALVNTLLQVNVPDAFRGRVMGFFMITFAGFVPFGNLFSGALAQYWGVKAALFSCGLICLGIFTLINFIFPELRDL